MAFPNNKIWGPQLWYILHTFAESIGKERTIKEKLLEAEEAVQFELFVKNIYKALPCAVCKNNAKEYLRTHPFSWNKFRREELREKCRQWLWNFHNAVNEETASQAVSSSQQQQQPAAEELSDKYKTTEQTAAMLQTAITIISAEQKLGIPYRLVLEDDLIIFRQRFNNLRSTIFG
jgi:hypothetical protein